MKYLDADGNLNTMPTKNRWGMSKRKPRPFNILLFLLPMTTVTESGGFYLIIAEWENANGDIPIAQYGSAMDRTISPYFPQGFNWCTHICDAINSNVQSGEGTTMYGGLLYNAWVRNSAHARVAH